MGDEQALRERLAAMETAALLEAWAHEERLPGPRPCWPMRLPVVACPKMSCSS